VERDIEVTCQVILFQIKNKYVPLTERMGYMGQLPCSKCNNRASPSYDMGWAALLPF
jgi:hypothetical protein